jgi:hypothetical protein
LADPFNDVGANIIYYKTFKVNWVLMLPAGPTAHGQSNQKLDISELLISMIFEPLYQPTKQQSGIM